MNKKQATTDNRKDAYYFSHDSNAHNDEKLINLRIKHDWQGYGLYWAIVELLRDANAYRLQCNFKALAYILHSDPDIIKSIINAFDLFIIDNDYFCSESLNNRMKLREEKSINARRSANKRWGNNANALPTHCEVNARKGKERKVNESKVNIENIDVDIIKASEEILKLHPNKGLPKEGQIAVMNAILYEIEQGTTKKDAIKFIKQATIDYNDGAKIKYGAKRWYESHGYHNVVSESKMEEY